MSTSRADNVTCRESQKLPATESHAGGRRIALPGRRTKPRGGARLRKSPLPDSNRRPPLYEGGPCVRWRLRGHQPGQGGRGGGGRRAALISLSPPRGRIRLDGRFAPVAHLLADPQAVRGPVAPAGAKGWLRVSMCQIASASRRARSTWATLAPRCLPTRVFVRW